MAINAGKLNKRIEFGKFKPGTNPGGFKENTWVPEFKMWAEAKNLYGKEFWAAQAVQSENTVKFKCRFDKRINEKLYILFDSNYYEIIAQPDDIGYLHRELEIKAKLVDKGNLNVS